MVSVLGRLIARVSLCLCALAPLAAAWAQPNTAHPGRVPYDRVCKVCHGEEGKGNAAPGLVPFSMDADELLIRVREGGGEMPPISENRVSDEEVRQIAAFLASLSAPGDPSASSASPDPRGR